MTERSPILNDTDHTNLDAFEEFRAGNITKSQAVGGIVDLIAALDKGSLPTARNWIEQGRKLLPKLAK